MKTLRLKIRTAITFLIILLVQPLTYSNFLVEKTAGLATISIPGDSLNPSTPVNIKIFSYEKHIDLQWDPNQEPDLQGYRVYKNVSGSFVLLATLPKSQTFHTDFIGTTGTTAIYKISAMNTMALESDLSLEFSGTTKALTDDEFMTMVQKATFRYFWDYAHPYSGLARERTGSGETVTIGGSGFGVMAIIVGSERGFVSRALAAQRMLKIVNFLNTKADRFHGVFSHWLNGTSGAVIPFSNYDNGGDLVETSFMIQGLLAARQYFNGTDSTEIKIRNTCTSIWEAVEWDWYRRTSSSNFLYWHWSPNFGWQMNFQLTGWNETMICYLLGVASPTHKIPKTMYRNGFQSPSGYYNGNTFYGNKLFVGQNYGGPLFFAHYSFLGFDPRNKKDSFCNYFTNNTAHTLINRAYCIANPYSKTGYNANCWGLTASDDPWGYNAHSPYNTDNGTITPTAALSSIPYTPTESIAAMRYFYNTYGANLWGVYGFKDAFNPGQSWFAPSYLAIDQGPIVIMIENYRSQLIWNKFMANPEISPMLDSIGFRPDTVTSIKENPAVGKSFLLKSNYPNPFNPSTVIEFNLPSLSPVVLEVFDILGNKVITLINESLSEGTHKAKWDGINSQGLQAVSGVYIYKLSTGEKVLCGKMVLQK